MDLGRLHALYALHGLNGVDIETLQLLLADNNPHVRRHAIRLSESKLKSTDLLNAVAKLVDDPSIEVRCQLAFSLAFVESNKRVEIAFPSIRT